MTVLSVVADPACAQLVMDDGFTMPLPAGCLYEPAELLDVLSAMVPHRERVLIIPDAWYGETAAASARAHSWSWPPPGDDRETERGWGAWTRFTRRRSPTIHVGIRSLIDDDRTPLFNRDDTPFTVARRLAEWYRLSGTVFRGSPGTVGLSILRDRIYTDPRHGMQPLWRVDPREELRGAGDLLWWRSRTDPERKLPFVHAFDMNGAYLHACMFALTGWDAPAHVGAVDFNPALAGFWRIDVPTLPQVTSWWTELNAPPLFPTPEPGEETMVLTTPMLRFLINQLADAQCRPPAVRDAWVCADSRLIWRPWAQQLAGLRETIGAWPGVPGDRAALGETAKRVVTEAIGLAAPTERRGGRVSRHDHRWQIVDWSRAILLGKAFAVHQLTGAWPVRIRTDCLWYPSEHADPMDAARALGIHLGTRLGQFKVHQTVAGEEWTDPDDREARKACPTCHGWFDSTHPDYVCTCGLTDDELDDRDGEDW